MTGWDAIGKAAKIAVATVTGTILGVTVVAASVYNVWRTSTRDPRRR